MTSSDTTSLKPIAPKQDHHFSTRQPDDGERARHARAGASTPLTAPDQIHDEFMRATNAKDVDGLLAMYDVNGLAVELDGTQCSGAAAMRAMIEGLTGAIRHIDGATRKLFVAGDIALSSATWTAEIALPDGQVIQQQGITAEVSQRQSDGTWKMLIDDPMFG